MLNLNSLNNLNGLGTGSKKADLVTPISPLTVKGGVVRVIDDATGDIARTTSGWIEDEKYGWYFVACGSAATSAEFDTSVTRTGSKTLKMSNTDVTGRWHVDTANGAISTIATQYSKNLIPIKPSTEYKISLYYKTTDRTNGNLVNLSTYNSSLTRLTQNSGIAVSGTNDWTLGTLSFTSDATATGLVIRIQNAAGAIEDTWIDINSMTLEEVSTITNSSSTPALFYPTATAVTSTDNIDQSQVVSDDQLRLGEVAGIWLAQQFTPTKKNLTGFIIRRGSNTGTYTGDVTISIQADSGSTTPSGTDLGTPITIANADWEAITADTDYTVSYPLTLTIGTTYWVVIKSSTGDNSNYSRMRVSSTNSYSGGALKYWNGSVWSGGETKDLYFKTLYSKNTTNLTVSTDTQTVSVTAPTVDGWANGEIISFPTPLTLASGENDIYVSSNGADEADGTVDSSLQAIMGGNIIS